MAKNLSCPVTDPLTQSSRPGCPEKMPGLHANITMQDIMEAIAEPTRIRQTMTLAATAVRLRRGKNMQT